MAYGGMPFVWSAPSHIFEFPRNSSNALGLGIEAQRAAIERFAADESISIIEEYAEFETGKGADALDRRCSSRRPWLRPRRQSAASLFPSWIGFSEMTVVGHSRRILACPSMSG